MALIIPQPLVEEVAKGRASLFLGAGASAEAHFPGVVELAEHLAARAGEPVTPLLSGQPLDVVAENLYQEPGYGKEWVRRELISFFEEKHSALPTPPSHAHDLMTQLRWRSIFTTNYDRLAEISYTVCQNSPQRILPIYRDDPQIYRHDPRVVRLFKLNGSVDEAARNSEHELVITFNDQIRARSRNPELYRLLQEEAIAGPIIFVGFRFAHPGATTTPGTSPEFHILQRILLDMGPAAKWHYSVCPYDETRRSDLLAMRTLTGSQIFCLNATFGEFLDALVRATGPVTPEAQAPGVTLSVGASSITVSSADYEKDKTQFEMLVSSLEQTPPPPILDSLDGAENWGTFFNKHIIERACKPSFRTALDNVMNNAPEFLLLGAPSGWGKTFLLRDIASDLFRERRPVIWLNPHSTVEFAVDPKPIVVSTWARSRLESLLRQIKDVGRPPHSTAILIADNCPERIAELIALYRHLSETCSNFVIVFAARDYQLEDVLKDHPVLAKAKRFIPSEDSSREEIDKLIEFCLEHQVTSITNEAQRLTITTHALSEGANIALILALQVIFDKEHRPFSKIIQARWAALDSLSQEVILRVSSLHRFGSGYVPRLYSLLRTFPAHEHSQVLARYAECRKERLLFERDLVNEPAVATLHSLVAERLTRCVEKVDADTALIRMASAMTCNELDLSILRGLVNNINDYKINLATEEITQGLFETAAASTEHDWVICQQFAIFLLKRGEYHPALDWITRALAANPEYAPIHHTKGNILYRWGVHLKEEDNESEALKKFVEARKCFALSRARPHPDEYGYVTHLSMLRYLIEKALLENKEDEWASLLGEGVQLYSDGIRAVPVERYNFLLEPGYRDVFDVSGRQRTALCKRIYDAIGRGAASTFAAAFLADELFKSGKTREAFEVLEKQTECSGEGVLVWVKRAELAIKTGKFSDAARFLDSGKRRQENAENDEVLWRLLFWDMIVSVVMEDFQAAGNAASALSAKGIFARRGFPRGYIWKEAARSIPAEKRSFKEHAKIWSGRIHHIRQDYKYGQIAMTDIRGRIFDIHFNPRYFERKELRIGEYVEFVIALLPNRLRAEDVARQPFRDTVDDIYVK